MAEPIAAPREREGQPLFIDGYFSARIWNGEEPNYGYPKNHLPETQISSMRVETGFLTALKSR